MSSSLRQFATLDKPVTSPSGEWSLHYDAGGRAVISDRGGTVTWAAGAAGTLHLEADGVFAVHDGGQVVWRAGLPEFGYTSLHVTDDGDGIFYDSWLPVHSILHGPVELSSLGDRAPAAAIRGSHVLTSGNGTRIVARLPGEGGALVHIKKLGPGASATIVVQPAEARTLDQPGTSLTWRFLQENGDCRWRLVLVGPEDDVRWALGAGHAGQPGPEPVAQRPATPAGEPPEQPGGSWGAWLDALGTEAYCLTVLRDVGPDEALRRLGAADGQVVTSTWAQLRRQAAYEEACPEDNVVAAFALGPHTLLVEDNGFEGVNRPELSAGTFAVSSYCSVNMDQLFLVSRDGVTLAKFDEGMPGDARGADPGVLTGALAEMGIDDPAGFDEDDDSYLDDVELLCRLGGIRPTVADVTGPARAAIIPGLARPWP